MKIAPSGSVVFLVSRDAELTRHLIAALALSGKHFQVPVATSVDQARARLSHIAPAVILLDESAIDGQLLPESAQEFACSAPVVVVAGPGRQAELADLVSTGGLDFVARTGTFLPMALSLLERRLRYAGPVEGSNESGGLELPHEFFELLRHEVNNPLTGILGNVEILLARRNRLPTAVVQRLETIADLAVRLRETLRQLTSNWEGRRGRVRSA